MAHRTDIDPQKARRRYGIVTAALIIGDAATVANVGDSRTYLLRDGRLEQITRDHSLVAGLVYAGIIEIQRIIAGTRSPQKACDALVAAANHAGGQDNIGVIVVEME